MTWSFTWTSCAYTDQPNNLDGIISHDPKAHWMLGDHSYFAWGYNIFSKMTAQLTVTPDATVWPDKARQFFSQPGWRKMNQRRPNMPMLWASCGDDHGLGGSNWDHTATGADGGAGTRITANPTLKQAHDHWVRAKEGHALLVGEFFDNPQSFTNLPVNTEVPAAVYGKTYGKPERYPKAYFYTDFTTGGTVFETAANALPSRSVSESQDLIVRVITLDTMSYKSPIDPAVVTGRPRTMLGAQQKQWLYDACQDAMTAGARMIVIASCKELFNTNNLDGWHSYAVERDEICQRLHDDDRPVVWISGDRHFPHVGVSESVNGVGYDMISLGGAPFATARADSLDEYDQELWRALENDTRVYGLVEVEEGTNGYVRFSLMNVDGPPGALSSTALWTGKVPFGSRVIESWSAAP